MAVSMEVLQLLHYDRYLPPIYVLVSALVYILAAPVLRLFNAVDIDVLRRTIGVRFGARIGNLLSRLLVR